MRSSERTIIYSALVVLGAMNLLFLLSASGRSAFAEAAAWLQSLGPAESLTLVDGENQLVLRNESGRLAWGGGDIKQDYTIAFVDIGRVMNPLMEAPGLVEERERLHEELQATEADYRSRLDAFGDEIQGMDRQSPEAQAKMEQARALYQEYIQWSQEAMEREGRLAAQHMQNAYRDFIAAVDVVAERLGADIVLRYNPPDKEFQSDDPDDTMTDIRLRTALRLPEGLDITEEVMQELAITDIEEE